MIKNLPPFIFSILIPGAGQLYLKDYKKGILILLILIIAVLIIPIIIFPYVYVICMIWSVTDIYMKLEKIEGRGKAIRNLIFSIIIMVILIPAVIYLLFISISIGGRYIENELLNLNRTENEMKKISIALENYYDYYKKYPTDYEAFVRTKPIWSDWATDCWGNRFRYFQNDSNDFKLISKGKDGKFDTEDDLTMTNEKK